MRCFGVLFFVSIVVNSAFLSLFHFCCSYFPIDIIIGDDTNRLSIDDPNWEFQLDGIRAFIILPMLLTVLYYLAVLGMFYSGIIHRMAYILCGVVLGAIIGVSMLFLLPKMLYLSVLANTASFHFFMVFVLVSILFINLLVILEKNAAWKCVSIKQ